MKVNKYTCTGIYKITKLRKVWKGGWGGEEEKVWRGDDKKGS